MNKKTRLKPLLAFLLALAWMPGLWATSDFGANVEIHLSDPTVGTETNVSVSFDTTSGILNDDRIAIYFPFGWDVSNAAFNEALVMDGTITFTTYPEQRKIVFTRNGDGTTFSAGSATLSATNIRPQSKPWPIGEISVELFDNAWTFQDLQLFTEFPLNAGPYDHLGGFTREGGVLNVNTDFEIKFGLVDFMHNHKNDAVIINPNFTAIGGTGSLTLVGTSVSDGIMTATLRYDQEEKIAIGVAANVDGQPRTGFLGHHYFVSTSVPPVAPGAPIVCPVGDERDEFILQWPASPTPNVTYEIWQHYSAYMLETIRLNFDPAYNEYLNYAEYFNGEPHLRYFSTFTSSLNGYNQWRLVDTVNWNYAGFVPTSPNFLGDYMNYSEFALDQYGSYSALPYYSNDWFRHPYGAFRIVAVDSSGARSLSSAEMVRAPWAQDGVFDPQHRINPPPENVVIFNEGGGTARIIWDQHFTGGGGPGPDSIDRWHVYGKVVNTAPGMFDEYPEYSYFSFIGETSVPTFSVNVTSALPTFHEYSSHSTSEPYGIFKIVGVSSNGMLTSSSAESRTLPFSIVPGSSLVSLDLVNGPPNAITTDQAIDVTVNLVDELQQVIFDDNSTIVQLTTLGYASPIQATAINGVVNFFGIRQFITGDHTLELDIVGGVGPGSHLSIPFQVTADATRIIAVLPDQQLVAGASPFIRQAPGTTFDATRDIAFDVHLYAVDNYNNIDPDFTTAAADDLDIAFGPWLGLNGPGAGVQQIVMSNGHAEVSVSIDMTHTTGYVTIDTGSLYATSGVTGDPSTVFPVYEGLHVSWICLDDIDRDGKTDRAIVSADHPLNDLTIEFDDTVSPPRVQGFYLSRPDGAGGFVRPDGWHSQGVLDDNLIMLVFDTDQSDGSITKDLTYYQDLGGVRGRIAPHRGYLYNHATWDNTHIGTAYHGITNKQTPQVTSDPAYGVNGSGHVSAITLDFSGPPPAELADPNRWIAIASDGILLNITGVGISYSTNSLTVSTDGTLGAGGQPQIGFVDFDFNFIPQGLIALPGQTSTGAAQIDLFWNPINDPNFQGSLVFRGTSAAGPWQLITTTTQTLTSDTAISTGTTYYYHLRSKGNGGVFSLPSSTVFAVVNGSPPTISAIGATPTSGTAPLQVQFSGTASDVDGTIVRYDWDFNTGDEIAVDFTSPTSATASWTYHEPGSYTAKLKVTDNDGNTDSDTVTITVASPASGPTANATLSTTGGPCPLVVTFADTSTAGSNPIALWQWDFQGDGIIDKSSYTTGDAVYTYRIPNQTYSSVKLRVTDTANLSSVKTFSIQVGAATNPPQVTLDSSIALDDTGAPITPVGSLPFCVTFDAATYDGAGGSIVKWEWDFDGDNLIDRITTRDDGIVTYCYSDPGSYSARVRVFDNDGLVASDSSFVQVSTPTNVNIILVEPVTLDKVGGDQLMMRAITIPNGLTSTVLFESSTNASSWTQVGTTQTGIKFEYIQSLTLSGFANGPIYLRARCTDVNAGSDTSNIVKVIKVPDQAAAVIETIVGGKISKQVSIDATQAQNIKASNGAGIKIPLGAISDDAIASGGLRIAIVEKGAVGASYTDIDGLPTSGGSPSLENLGRTISFDLNLNGGGIDIPEVPLTLTIPYPDENDDGFVDGTSKRETDLEIWWYEESTGTWRRAISTIVDAENNFLTVTVGHLTDFGMFATVVSSALGGASGVPGGSVAGSGLCLIGTPTEAPLTWIAGLLLAALTVRWWARRPRRAS